MPQLLFVYNAEAGALNGLLDTLHKTLSPQTYACSLCRLTYGAMSMHSAWKQFVQELGIPSRFLHRKEFIQEFPALRQQPLPAAFWQNIAGEWQLLVSKEEFDQADLTSLMQLIRTRLGTLNLTVS
ncbi:hypothetical protein [Hymenobacter sp. GOD-10R]|uniref:hypothetical protein n=1 Tax=Hymenobacter sp. GOD-10R TaxID=3093922 RepID=UPI002D76A7B0|nr:hypothetical protein [Hymenobacter sp. GOD-10R]WRQ30962.1 hypothetical protein SD425_11900 [Hymenobacter sp. GOD-10R]